MSEKEITAIVRCVNCNTQKAVIYSVLIGSGVRHNVTEPVEWQGATKCIDCNCPLTTERRT